MPNDTERDGTAPDTSDPASTARVQPNTQEGMGQRRPMFIPPGNDPAGDPAVTMQANTPNAAGFDPQRAVDALADPAVAVGASGADDPTTDTGTAGTAGDETDNGGGTAGDTAGHTGSASTGDRYESMTGDELKAELSTRRDDDGKPLKVSGTKAELVDRLRKHDTARQQQS